MPFINSPNKDRSPRSRSTSPFPVLTNLDGTIVVEPFKLQLRETEENLFVPTPIRQRFALLSEHNLQLESCCCGSELIALATDPLESPLRNLLSSFDWKENRDEFPLNRTNKPVKKQNVDHSTTVAPTTRSEKSNEVQRSFVFPDEVQEESLAQNEKWIPFEKESAFLISTDIDNSRSVPTAESEPAQHQALLETKQENEPHGTSIIVLISKQSLKREIAVIQEKAMNVLDCHKIPYSVIDGADPTQKDVRNSLFDVSGVRGKYPQFFIHDDSSTSSIRFWGDWDTFECANENGIIRQELLGSTATELCDSRDILVSSPDSKPMEKQNEKEGNDVIVLISKQSLKREIAVIQEKAMTLLDCHKIPYSVVDGADPTQKDVRNALFDISGVRGKYPQFFVRGDKSNDSIVFWGDWDAFEYANENGTIRQELVGCSTTLTDISSNVPIVPDSSVAPSAESDSKSTVLVLCSKQSLKREVTVNQEKAFTILQSLKIEYEILDGADLINKDRRNELFELSGIRGEYPQFFVVTKQVPNLKNIEEHQKTTIFWGGWDRFEFSNENGSLLRDLF